MAPLQRSTAGEGIEVLRLDRPEQRNAMDSMLLRELLDAMDALARDPLLRVLVFSTTSVGALCAGVDVKERLDRRAALARTQDFLRFYAALEAFPAPTVAVCVGHCVGGGAELAAGCDLRIAGENLKLAWAGARLGVPIGPARLTPLVGLARAKELVFTGRVVGATEAFDMGLVHATVPAAAAEATAIALAEEVAAYPPPNLRGLKQMFRELEDCASRVARENALLEAFQRDGAGLPQGPKA